MRRESYMGKSIDYEELSKEELIRLLLKSDKEKKELSKEITKKNKAISYRDSKIEKLEVENRNLNIQIEQLIAKYEDKLKSSKKFQIEKFIQSSEKLKEKDLIINEIEAVKEKKPRKSPTESFIKDLKDINRAPDIIVDYDFNDIDTSKIKPFKEDETYKLEYKPATFELVKIVKKKYKDKERIYEGVYDDPFPHSPLTPSMAANLIEMKFNLGVPFYRYSNYLIAHGINISDIDICRYASRTMELLNPLYEKLFTLLLNNEHKVIHADETPLKVLQSEKEKCYMFVYATSFWDKPIYIYDFVDGRSTKRTVELLEGYDGYLVCDGYAGYDSLKNMGVKLQRCMVHSRRYFNDVVKTLDENERKKSRAYKVLEIMSKLFQKEAEFKEKKYTASKIKEERSSDSYLQIIKELNEYIDSIDCRNNEGLSKAVNYYHNHKEELYTYLESGYVDLSNNLAERVVKPFVVNRRSFLFCKTIDGAMTTGKLFSIVQTARANGLKSEQYLSYVISNINKKDINDLLPWSDKLPKDLLISSK